MENKDSIKPLERKMKYLYELGADVTFEFDNGDTIRINKTVLAFHTEFLADVFFGQSPATNFKVENFDSDTFRTFLDCLFGLKEYSVLDSLLIYPIAHQYQVKESLEKCVAVLEPKVMDENVSLILNLAWFYKDEELVNNVIDFIKTENGIVDFIENENYRDSLEPISMCKLIEETRLDSFVWNLIYEWGETHLKKQCKSVDIRSFFDEIGIFSKLELDHFESVQSIFDFHEMSNMQLFDSTKILLYLKYKMSDPKTKLPDKSEWIKLAGETFTEVIEFTHSFAFSSEDHENGLSIQIWMNEVFYDNSKHNRTPVVCIAAEYSVRSISLTVLDCSSKNHASQCRRRNHSSGDCKCWVPLKISSFGPSGSETVGRDLSVVSYRDEPVCKLDVTALQHHFQEIKSIEVAYNFEYFEKCRILKTTLNGNFVNADELYFTKNVVVSSK